MIYSINLLLSGVATCLEKEETHVPGPVLHALHTHPPPPPPQLPADEIRDAAFKCSTSLCLKFNHSMMTVMIVAFVYSTYTFLCYFWYPDVSITLNLLINDVNTTGTRDRIFTFAGSLMTHTAHVRAIIYASL